MRFIALPQSGIFSGKKRLPGLSKRVLVIMKLAAFILLIAFTQISAKGLSQTVTISRQNISLAKIFRDIQRQTGYNFLCTKEQLSRSNKINIDLKNAPVKEVLDHVFKDQPLTYDILNNTIIVKKKETVAGEQPVIPPPVHISGIVTDSATGKPLAGVTVKVKGNTMGTITDADGKFSLDVPDDAVLEVSYLGYISKEIPVNGRTDLRLTLTAVATGLNQLVVIGYGTIAKKDLTGAVSSLGIEDFNKGLQTSVDQMMKGRVPGVHIIQSSSEPGGGVSVRIRGVNSLTASNDPLYVIDGFPIDNTSVTPGGSSMQRNPLNTLNPQDIASIEILKDASATAIYGARGANGVVLITTKKGKEGKLSINYNAYAGVQEVAKTMDLLNTSEYISFLNDLRKDEGEPPEFSEQEINEAGKGTDWQREIFRKAPVQNHQLSFSGGSENTKYYISLNYLDQAGIVIGSGIKRYSSHLSLSHSINKFNFGVNLNTSLVKDNFVRSDPFDINAGAGVVASAIQMDLTIPVRDSNGEYTKPESVDLENPLALAYGQHDNAKTNRTFGDIFAEYEILESLKAKLTFGSDRRSSRRDFYNSRETKRGEGTNGLARVGVQERNDYLVAFTLSYDKYIHNDNHINAVLGYTYQEFNASGLNANAFNFNTDDFLTNNLSAGDKESYDIGSGRSKHQLLSYLGRVNYTFKDKYLATASFRIDGSSRFGEDEKFGYFPSLALGWRLDKESFIADMGIFSSLKLRASYGVTGNQAIGNYNSLALLGPTATAIYGDAEYNGLAPIQLANPELKWETTKQYNAGLDYGFLNGRINGSIDFYIKNTSNLLLNLPIPSTTGFTTSLQNVGGTRNSGFEFMINSENFTGKFSWNTTFNLATNKNKVTDLGGLPFILQGGARFVDQISILREGDPINAYYGYKVKGIFHSEDEVKGSAQPFAKPGEIWFDDVNKDGKITSDDRTLLGSPYPDFSFGLSNHFSYAGFDLDVFFYAEYGKELFNFNRLDTEYPFSFRRNRLAYVLNRWTPENSSSNVPSYLNPSVSYGSKVNSRVIEDASYLRLENIKLSYNFPALRSKTIRSLSVYLNVQNLFTITNYSGFNPDVNAFGDSNIVVDYNAYPLAKVYTVGFNIGF